MQLSDLSKITVVNAGDDVKSIQSGESSAKQAPTVAPPLFTVANPGPLGLTAFATTTFALSVCNTGLIPPSVEQVVVSMALFHGGAVQLLAGMWQYLYGNIFGATVFSSYGAFWMSFAYFVNFLVVNIPAEDRGSAVGLFLLSWTICTFFFLIASYKTHTSVFMLFVFLEITFILLTVGNFGGYPTVVHAGGWFGIMTAFIAYYVGLGELVNAVWKQDVIPLTITKKLT